MAARRVFTWYVVSMLALLGALPPAQSRPQQNSHDPQRTHHETGSINNPNECGRPTIQPSVRPRIVSGSTAVPNSWPWMVSMQSSNYGGHFCGASLINERWILTAAHCPVSPGQTTMVVGMHYVDGRRTRYQKHMQVVRTIAHEGFGQLPGGGIGNDLRLVKLANPVQFNTGVQPVCLPYRNQSFEAGRHCFTTGWGTMRQGAGATPEDLQQVMVPIQDNELCNLPMYYNNRLDFTNLCAGYTEGGRDSCQGDSGGPLVCLDGDRWVLAGVVSWGEGCAWEVKPGLYARVSLFIDWIEQHINEDAALNPN